MDILFLTIGASVFLTASVGWFCAVGLPQSRFSHYWYGKKWSPSFSAAQKRSTTIRGLLVGSGYLLLGLDGAVMALKELAPSIRSTLSGVQWLLLGLAALCMISAALAAFRQN